MNKLDHWMVVFKSTVCASNMSMLTPAPEAGLKKHGRGKDILLHARYYERLVILAGNTKIPTHQLSSAQNQNLSQGEAWGGFWRISQ